MSHVAGRRRAAPSGHKQPRLRRRRAYPREHKGSIGRFLISDPLLANLRDSRRAQDPRQESNPDRPIVAEE